MGGPDVLARAAPPHVRGRERAESARSVAIWCDGGVCCDLGAVRAAMSVRGRRQSRPGKCWVDGCRPARCGLGKGSAHTSRARGRRAGRQGEACGEVLRGDSGTGTLRDCKMLRCSRVRPRGHAARASRRPRQHGIRQRTGRCVWRRTPRAAARARRIGVTANGTHFAPGPWRRLADGGSWREREQFSRAASLVHGLDERARQRSCAERACCNTAPPSF